MAKSASNRATAAGSRQQHAGTFVKLDKRALDPNISSLFAKSLGPVKAPSKARYRDLIESRPVANTSEGSEDEGQRKEVNEDTTSVSDDISSDIEVEKQSVSNELELPEPGENVPHSQDHASAGDIGPSEAREYITNSDEQHLGKKRKRTKETDVEDNYMQKLAREEAREEEERGKKRRTVVGTDTDSATASGSDDDNYTIPKHETQTGSADMDEVDKASRTVFLGNVSSTAITSKTAKKTLTRHLGSFLEDLADHKPPHKIESLRFRSTAFASALPKKAAFVNKEILDATTKSTNAYVVYSTKIAAREAAKRLNGTMVLNRHLRVDSVAHPAKVDHRRCVFIGNLGFVDDESTINASEEDKKKTKPPADTEEGLWVQFSKAGKVESVRVVRDSKTRVSKGFAYVQFEDENSVEAALQYNDQKYPPMLPRKLRVVRAKAPKKKSTSSVRKPQPGKPSGVYSAKVSEKQKTDHGRARAMLGKAAAFKKAEDFVFEGHRASRKDGAGGPKTGPKKRTGKPQSRSSKRGAAWKDGAGRTKQ